MQPFENTEDLLVIARIDPDTVVSNGELDLGAALGSGNMNPGRLGSAEHNRVHKQLAEYLCQLPKIEKNGR
jgi:hypothetical protein